MKFRDQDSLQVASSDVRFRLGGQVDVSRFMSRQSMIEGNKSVRGGSLPLVSFLLSLSHFVLDRPALRLELQPDLPQRFDDGRLEVLAKALIRASDLGRVLLDGREEVLQGLVLLLGHVGSILGDGQRQVIAQPRIVFGVGLL